MFYLIIQLFKEKYEEEVLLALTSAGVDRATVTDNINLEKIVHSGIPIFAGVPSGAGEEKRFCKIFTAAVKDEHVVDDFLSALKAGGVDFLQDDIGIIILLPAARILKKDSVE